MKPRSAGYFYVRRLLMRLWASSIMLFLGLAFLALASEASASSRGDSSQSIAVVTKNGSQPRNARTCSEVVGPNTKYDASSYSGRNAIRPELDASDSILKIEVEKSSGNPTKRYLEKYTRLLKDVKVTIIQAPKHGKLLPVKVEGTSGYFFMADQGYFGRDRILFSVQFGNGQRVLLTNDISVVDFPSEYKHTAPCSTTATKYNEMRQQDFNEIKRRWDGMHESHNEIDQTYLTA